MKTLRIKQPADRLGKHSATIWRAIRCGAIDIDDENSIQQYLLGNKRRQNPNTIGQPNADVTETNIARLNPIELALSAGAAPRQRCSVWKRSRNVRMPA